MNKRYRVKKNEEFQKIMREGQSFANRQLVIYYLKRDSSFHFRVGLSIGKKIGNAVKRNYIKRCLRESLNEVGSNIKPNVDFIIIARQPTRSMSYFEIKKSLNHLLYKTDLFL